MRENLDIQHSFMWQLDFENFDIDKSTFQREIEMDI